MVSVLTIKIWYGDGAWHASSSDPQQGYIMSERSTVLGQVGEWMGSISDLSCAEDATEKDPEE